jgi:hypothetical protein
MEFLVGSNFNLPNNLKVVCVCCNYAKVTLVAAFPFLPSPSS